MSTILAPTIPNIYLAALPFDEKLISISDKDLDYIISKLPSITYEEENGTEIQKDLKIGDFEICYALEAHINYQKCISYDDNWYQKIEYIPASIEVWNNDRYLYHNGEPIELTSMQEIRLDRAIEASVDY